jgi:hypothetical protein
MDSEYSPMPLGFSMVLPCILTPQSLSKFHGYWAFFTLENRSEPFLRNPLRKEMAVFFLSGPQNEGMTIGYYWV